MQINCVFRNGSTGRITENIHNSLLENGLESVILYGREGAYGEPNIYKVSSELEAKIHSVLFRLFSVEFGYSPISTKRAIGIIKKEQPDVVHLHCLNGNFINVYKLLSYLKENKIKTVLTLHAEIMHTAGCTHAVDCEKWKQGCNSCNEIGGILSKYFRDDSKHCYNLMKKAIQGFDDLTVVGVSQWLTDRAKQSAIMSGVKFETIHNGIDTDVFHFVESDDLRERLKISKAKKIILHVTPNFTDEIKGGKYVVELAKRMPEYQFIIVGFNGNKRILPSNIIPIEHTKDAAELAQYYSMADVTLLTSKRETFSMVCAESLCCGTPVAGFMAGGPESISLGEYSSFVDFGDLDELKGQIIKLLLTSKESDNISLKAINTYSKDIMSEKHLKIYQNYN